MVRLIRKAEKKSEAFQSPTCIRLAEVLFFSLLGHSKDLVIESTVGALTSTLNLVHRLNIHVNTCDIVPPGYESEQFTPLRSSSKVFFVWKEQAIPKYITYIIRITNRSSPLNGPQQSGWFTTPNEQSLGKKFLEKLDRVCIYCYRKSLQKIN